MKLSAAANRFNRMVCKDAYTGAFLFKGQLGLYDDNKRDSETAERRVLSLAADAAIPTRRVIAAAGTRFIVGHSNPDDFNGQTIRVGYTLHEAPLQAQVRTLQQVCLQQLGTTAYVGRAWVKDKAYAEQSSDLNPQYHLHFSVAEQVSIHQMVTIGSTSYVVRVTNIGAGGTLVATCDEMPAPVVENATILNGTYDAVADAVVGTPDDVNVVRIRWQSIFQYLNRMAPKFEAEDMQLAIAQSDCTVAPGATVTLSDGVWRIASAVAEDGVWLCRAVRHAGA